jgi:hypothetical protein
MEKWNAEVTTEMPGKKYNGHATVREEKIAIHGLEATSCATTNENEQTLFAHTSLWKKYARHTYMKQIK